MSFIANGKHEPLITVLNKKSAMASAFFEPDPLEKLNWLIHLYHVRGETIKCREMIKTEIFKTKGKHEYAHFKQGIILKEENKIPEALESFQICYKLNNENTDNIKEVANCLFILRKYRLSLEAYLEAEKNSYKPDWEIYHNIGQCLMCLGENGKAQEYINQAVHLGKQERSYSLLIKLLLGKGDLQSAIKVATSALEACPDSINMLTSSGLLHLKAGQTQKAFENLSLALALDSNCSQALLGIGCITQAHEEYDVALSKYKVAVQIDPESIALWNNIGMCFYSKQKYVAAISCLKRALWLDPLNWKVLLNLGLVHLQTLQPASAFNFLCAAVNLRPEMGLTFLTLGAALFELKDMENSLRAFRQAQCLLKDDVLGTINVVLALMVNEMYEEAWQCMSKFKTLVEHEEFPSKQALELGSRLESILIQATCSDHTVAKTSKQFGSIEENVPSKNVNSVGKVAEESNRYSDNRVSNQLASDEV